MSPTGLYKKNLAHRRSATINIDQKIALRDKDKIIEEIVESKEKKLDSFINRIRVKRKDWKNLEELAFKTYVPESKISREKGAGSGDLIDD